MSLSPYEAMELPKLLDRKEKKLARQARRIVPQRVRDGVSGAARSVGGKASKIPGASQMAGAAEAAAGGIGKAVGRTAQSTLSDSRVLAAYAKRGVEVETLAALATVDLSCIDRVARFTTLRHRYAMTALVEGGLAGLFITGGTAAAAGGGVFGLGAGAAPGLGATAATTAGDAAAVLAMSARVVAHTAMYYGYDPKRPDEEIFMMSVIGLGVASGQTAKTAAFSELSQLTQLLARRAPWAQLNEHLLADMAQRFAVRFGQRLTQRKLGQFVPVAGIALGAGLNYALLDSVADAADIAYRERYLREKGGTVGDLDVTGGPELDDDTSGEIHVGILDIVRDEFDLDDSDGDGRTP